MGVYKGESFSQEEWDKKNINAATGKPFGQASEEAVQDKAQDWRNQGSPMPGTKDPEDIRSLGQQFMDWSTTPAGSATLGGLGLLAAGAAYGLTRRKTSPEAPKSEPYVAPSYDYETTAREVPERKGLPQPSTPVPEVAAAPAPVGGPPAAPTGVPSAQPQFTVAGQVQPQMQYGQTNTTAPAGALTPLNPVQQPSGEPAVPTAAPKPVDPVVQAKLDAYAAEERRKQLAFENQQRRLDAEHQAKLDKQVSAAKPKTTTKEPVIAKPITSPAEIPSIDVTSQQAAEEIKSEGNIKTGKAGGSITPQEGTTLGGEASGKVKAEVSDVVKGAVAPQRTDFQKTLGQPTAATGSGMPAYVGEGGESAKVKKVFSSMKEVPSGYVFVPEGRYMDTIRNAVGQDLYTAKLNEFGGYPLTQEQAYKQAREMNQSVGRAARTEAKAAGASLGEVTPAITKQIGSNKLVKVAGVGGALISLADLAKAQSVSEATLRGADIATDYIPLVGQIKQALTSSTAGAPVVPESRFSEAAKLGSPYYGTEWAKAQRSKPVPPPR
jgi:hypothetical protein